MVSVLLLTSLAGAATVEGPVFPDAMERTHVLSNYLETRMGQHPRDRVPSGVDRAVLRDDARLVSLDGDKACFEVITRTASAEENAMGPWSFLVGQKKTQVWGTPGEVQVYDYSFTGERTKLDLAVFGEAMGGALKVTEPVEKVFRVIERKHEVCGEPVLDKKGRVVLRVLLTAMHGYDEDYIETFRWLVQ